MTAVLDTYVCVFTFRFDANN